ncbi:hypothetical protein LC040_07045 [Bacillus tianshenii]|nr:hypothetical protein LC040_07045 [Bacillus tianshenii]
MNVFALAFIFIVSGLIAILSAIQLSTYADIISKKTNIGGFLIGTILLAVATSLPELTTTVSASIIGSADIVIGNGLGSILFNFFFLFLLDIHFRKKRLFLNLTHQHFYTTIIVLLLFLTSSLGIVFDNAVLKWGISATSIVLFFIYIGGMWFISKLQIKKSENENEVNNNKAQNLAMAQLMIRFFAFSILIFISGSALSISGDELAKTTGISATIIGSILVAIATSVPDAMGVYAALKLANVNMAVGAILGSNAFNISIISIGDLFYRKESIWKAASGELLLLAILGCVLTLIVMAIIKRKQAQNTFSYLVPSFGIVGSYLVVMVLLLI